MIATRTIALALVLALAGCGGSNRDPQERTAFGRWIRGEDRIERLEPAPDIIRTDNRVLVGEITRILAEEVPGGVILWAEGLPPTEGYHSPGLVQIEPDSAERGTLFYEFRVAPPPRPAPVGNAETRMMIEAIFISDIALEGITQATVIGQSNRRSTRRVVRLR